MQPNRRPLPVLLLALATGLAAAAPCAGDPAPAAPLPADWVAQCGGRILTLRGLAVAAVNRLRMDLLEATSGPLTVLRQMTEERVVAQEAARLRIAVTDADVEARYQALDREVRERSNGARTLRDVMEKDMHVSPTEFRGSLKHLMRKERIAADPQWLGASLPANEAERLGQVQVVATELLKRARIEYGVPTSLQAVPSALGPGEVARVNGEPITREEYGVELARRLPADDVLRIIQQECKSVLTETSALTEQEMEAEIDKERKNWDRYREMSSQEALKGVSYDEYVKAQHRVALEDLKRDRFFRGLFGLIRGFRAQVTPDEVKAAFEANRATLYGEALRVQDVQINFVQKNALLPGGAGRDRKEALRLANEILVKKESGVPFDEIVREVAARRDRSFLAVARRLRNTDDDRLLWEKGRSLRDGDVAVVETISAVHVLRREALLPPPAFEDVRAMIAEGLARQKADAWLRERLQDESVVKIRWPLPDEVWPPSIR